MSAEQVVQEEHDVVDVDASVVAEARTMGWVPEDEFKGDKSKWIDASEFVENGRKVLPILRKNNQTLMQSQTQLHQKIAELEGLLQNSAQQLNDFQEFHKEELTRRVTEERARIKKDLKAAKEDNDVDAEIELVDQLQRLNSAERAAKDANDKVEKEEKAAPAQGQEFVATPELVAFRQQFPQFEKDEEFTFDVLAIGARLKKAGFTGQAFYSELAKRINEGAPPPTKVAGSRGGATSSRGNGKSFSDLPTEARAVCDRYQEKMVGPDKQFKTQADWRRYYIDTYENE